MVTVCFHWDDSILGGIIRWQTHGRYSHVSLVLPDGRHTEARWGDGVVVWPHFRYRDEHVDRFALDLDNEQLARGLAFMDREVGCGYDYAAIAAFLLRRQPPHKASDTRWFCSEYVYAWLQAAGVDLLRDTQPWQTHPSLLSKSTLLVPA